MKSTSLPLLKIAAAIFVFGLAAALLAFFLAAPVTAGPGDGPAAMNIRLAIAVFVFIASLLGALVAVLALRRTMAASRSLQEISDAVRTPAFILDSENRFQLLNQRAEKILGISRDRDIGRTAPADIVNAIRQGAVGDPSIFNAAATVQLGGRYYQVAANPLAGRGDGLADVRHIVLLPDVTAEMRIRDTMREIIREMDVLTANSRKISNSSVSLSQGTTEQASSLAAITSSMDEFSKKIRGSTESAAKGTQLAAQAREAAERSGKEIINALSAMTDVQDAGIRIARIVKLIDDIAFQTNLLALNAAVEAARAGRQGKGFAVVADEVRNLAGRSAKAAKDTASMVEDVTERIGNASAYISKLEEMLRNIVQDAIRMADSSALSSAVSTEQANGILQVNKELGQMNSVTQTTMLAAEQAAAAVEVLTGQVDSVKHKLDALSIEYEGKLSAPADSRSETSINLFDYSETGDPVRSHSYLTRSDASGYDDDAAPARGSHLNSDLASFRRRAEDWNLENDDDDSHLANLLRSESYTGGRTGENDASPTIDLGPIPGETRTKEGDRMVKPNQNIHLDDYEFGRY